MTQAIENSRVRRLPPAGGRIPPHDLDAEESLLGAMLLSRDAIAAALECCAAEDFYKPAHAHIFSAVTALYTRGEPADPVTVADELRRTDVLEAVGDPSVLISLQVNTPSTANASHYARIVEEHALLRRLVSVAGEIAELGYSVPGDVTEVIDRAESLVFEVAQRRMVDTMSSLRDLLAASLDHLENLYARGDTITGVPTGYSDLDERLAGLQRSNLVVVGARPAMGKALALDTPVPTPSGWTTMGGLRVGDEVYDERGVPCRVEYVSPVFTDHPCYRVAFDDGSVVVADAGHRWLVYDNPAWKARSAGDDRLDLGRESDDGDDGSTAGPRVVTTEELAAEQYGPDGEEPNWFVPLAGVIEAPEAEVPVDPYVFGCWLGDGSTTSPEITLEEEDAAFFVAEFEARGYPLVRRAGLQWSTEPVPPTEPVTSGPRRLLSRELGRLGPSRRIAKRIPTAYLRSSAKHRLELLQGIMDATGTVSRVDGTAEICLANRGLLEQVRELACSLGHRPSVAEHRTVPLPDGRDVESWRIRWTPLDPVFRLPRKAAALASVPVVPGGRHTRRAVVSVEPADTVPVGCIAVSSPSHLFLAGRSMIPTHNTSFALGIVANAAVHARVPVLLFSLEMSHLELTQRLLCSEARVDATRMRNGRLLESDWPKISDAIGRLGDAPIYIDDNPNVTVMDIRAKARRLKAREGLGLVVVDYLQLMSGHARSRAENRQVEVSEISRGLKVLARELDIPVIALSQLSRNLEMRQDKRPVLADLRESGCLTADTRVTRADTGAEVALGELLLSGERNISVWALDESLRLVPATMTHVFPSGVKRTYELRLASGRRVQASANHPFRTVTGWRRLDELQVGDRLATPRVAPPPENRVRWDDAEVVMLAHLLGDGCFASGQPLHYTSADEANLQAVEEAAAHFGITPRRVSHGSWSHVYLPAPFRLTVGRRNPVVAWLDTLGLGGLQSHEKFIPSSVFALGQKQLALFIRHLWATDGCLWWRGTGQIRCYYASSSRRMAEDVQALLLRFGIVGRIKVTTKGSHGPMYNLNVFGSDHQLRFIRQIGVHGARGDSASTMAAHLQGLTANTNVDTVPREVWSQVRAKMRAAGLSHRGFSSTMGWQYSGSARRRYSPSRPVVGGMADVLDDDELRVLARSDVFWDEIVAIEDRGDAPVYDATVLEHHNFLANGIVAHNSIEQDADVVMFIYRDEVYNPDSPDRGSAEIIIAKHRNGPVGVTNLAFMDHHTRFANIARM